MVSILSLAYLLIDKEADVQGKVKFDALLAQLYFVDVVVQGVEESKVAIIENGQKLSEHLTAMWMD